tara:strand:+ start:1138 stop:1530 length:393 start_codon:yes stop_codon:yes gene_type:complete
VKVYKRLLNATKAACLLGLCRVHERNKGIGWVHVSEVPWQGADARAAGGELAKLELWGLIERRTPNEDATKRCSGMWQATRRGVLFAMERIQAPKYVYTYNGSVLDTSEELIGVREALGTKFSYAALMAR